MIFFDRFLERGFHTSDLLVIAVLAAASFFAFKAIVLFLTRTKKTQWHDAGPGL